MEPPFNQLKFLVKKWRERATAQGLRGKKREDACLEFFIGAYWMAHNVYGKDGELPQRLLRLCTFVLCPRGIRGLDEYMEVRDGEPAAR